MGELCKITPELIAEMEADRDSGMIVSEIAKKYGISESIIYIKTRSRNPRKEVPQEAIGQMQADRDAGMSTRDIGRKYGISQARVCAYTQKSQDKAPITQEELAAMRAGLHPGSMMDLPVMQHDDEGRQVGLKKERCRIEHVSRHTVVFRRPNGRPEHRMLVELCQIRRGIV